MSDPSRDHLVPSPPGSPAALVERAQEVIRRLQRLYLAKDELSRMLVLSMVAGEHLLIVGPPGTAKSALARSLSRLVDARYFEYLLTRFTEPNELLGPVDLRAFREGTYRRRTEQMLPEAELVFLDEIFKASSAILNSLLSLLNERRVYIGAERIDAPLLALVAASNEVPADDSLSALLDRFLLRVRSNNVEGFHFQRLLELGLTHEQRLLGGDAYAELQPLLSVREVLSLRHALRERLRFGEDFLSRYKALLFQIRGEGIAISDRRAVKLLKLCAASALLDGREAADEGDLLLLRHTWQSPEQAEILDGLLAPVVQRFQREHPERRGGPAVLPEILRELESVRAALREAGALSDVQLLSQLRALGELRAQLALQPGESAETVLREVDALLDTVLAARERL